MKRNEILILCLLTGLAIFLRFWMLGAAPFTADTMEFYKLSLRDQNIIEFWKNPPWMNQIPFSETLSLLMIKAGLPATPFVVRLPFALMGLFTLFFLWRFSRNYFGAGAALLVLVLAILNPYAIYQARQSYYYSGVICFSAALFWVFWLIKERLQKKEQPGRKYWILWFVTAALVCHMHMCAWMVAGLQALLIFAFGLVAFTKDSGSRRKFLVPFFVGSIALGLLMSRWIVRGVQEVIKNSVGGGHHIGSSARAEFLRLFPAYFSAENIFAIILLFIFIGLTVLALFGTSDSVRRFRSLAWICALHLAVLLLYVGLVGGGIAKITYFSGVWPHFIFLIGIGAYLGAHKLASKLARTGLCILLAGSYVVLTAWPACAIVRLEGTPTPFYKINDWVLENLPAGTPVLTDRWLEPWNELAVHNPGGINYTFTVPDEPVETYRQLNWRRTAEQFFEKYPEAAFLELSRGKYDVELGRWNFPSSYFARCTFITNAPALDLRRWKVFVVESSADTITNRVITRIFYNTPDDLIAAARRDGKDVLRLYGTGWGYAKPGWQQGHFEDYRILGQTAAIDLYNLKDDPLSGMLEISAATAERPKTISAASTTTVFAPGRIRTWTIPLTLKLGQNTIPFTSPSSDPLFVLDIRWKAAQP